MMIPNFNKIEDKVLKLEHSRDAVMQRSRELIRTAGKAIAMMHASGPRGAQVMLKELKRQKASLSSVEKGFEYYALQAHQEYAEALILHSILSKKVIPSMGSIGEAEVAYLLGLMDVVGELKREAIESLRKGKNKDAKEYYKIMADIYDSTLHMRFANSVLPDFRRKQDVARIQLESVMNEMLRLSKPGYSGK